MSRYTEVIDQIVEDAKDDIRHNGATQRHLVGWGLMGICLLMVVGTTFFLAGWQASLLVGSILLTAIMFVAGLWLLMD